ncbi:hypothetical protein SteCoe_29380 [Stentor coeruleus]|uniref:Uncharacterized protein n=1 Tax=Stentor coeruleus TaxID=5963 RepID=A0A1R2B6I7_9CILI|nr:hypothetical protein SteCoe_29380 [Stentor coeruleus]
MGSCLSKKTKNNVSVQWVETHSTVRIDAQNLDRSEINKKKLLKAPTLNMQNSSLFMRRMNISSICK